MNITVEQIRENLRKDDFEYINNQIAEHIPKAKAALLASIGYKEGDALPEDTAEEFEVLSNSYISEYCRAFIDGVDNERMLTIISCRLETLMRGR